MTGLPIATIPADLIADLDPETVVFIRNVYRDGVPATTLRAYRSDLQYFWAWYAVRHRLPVGSVRPTYPVAVATVLTFISDHLGQMPVDVEAVLTAPRPGVKGQRPWKQPGPHKLVTVRRRLATLAKIHQVQGHTQANPVATQAVQELLQRARRSFAGTALTRVNKKRAADLELVERLVGTCGGDLAGIRDQAIIWVAWASGGRRRSEIAQLDMNHLKRISVDGVSGFVISLGTRKTHQDGTEKPFPVLDRSADALEAWLARSEITSGRVFRGFTRNGGLRDSISAQTIYTIVKYRAEKAGLDPAEFGAHSLRSGFVSEAGAQDIPALPAMALTDHTSMATYQSYFQETALVRNPAARLSRRPKLEDRELAEIMERVERIVK